MREIGVAIVGFGYAGRAFHSYLVGLTPGLKLRGVVSRSEEGRAKIRAALPEAKAFGDLREALNDPAVELVVVATPHHVHAAQAIEALDAGKHVVVDKAMCLNLEECDRMIAVAKRAERLLTVFHNRRWDGDFLTVQRLVAEGRIGPVRWIEVAWQNFGPPRRWRGEAASGGGRFYDLGTHLIDQVLLLRSERVASVWCRMHHDFAPDDTDTESHALAVLGFEGGATAVVDVSSQTLVKKPRFLLCGSAGTFVKHGLDPQENAMREGRIDEAREREDEFGKIVTPEGETVVPTQSGRWRCYYENVAAAIRGDAAPAVSLESMRRLMRVLDACRESARAETTVFLT